MVTATNTATSVPYTGVTNEAGVYTINALPIGTYQVKVELQGFKAVTSQRARSRPARRPVSMPRWRSVV